MADKYDRTLECGCMISSDGGGGLMPCCYGYGCGKTFILNRKEVECNEKHECPECIEHNKLHSKFWKEWKKTDDYKKHCNEVQERNQ